MSICSISFFSWNFTPFFSTSRPIRLIARFQRSTARSMLSTWVQISGLGGPERDVEKCDSMEGPIFPDFSRFFPVFWWFVHKIPMIKTAETGGFICSLIFFLQPHIPLVLFMATRLAACRIEVKQSQSSKILMVYKIDSTHWWFLMVYKLGL